MSNDQPRICKCNSWDTNIDKINSIIVAQAARTGHSYSGEFFKYCPWCGTELVPDGQIRNKHA